MYNILLCKIDRTKPTTPGGAIPFEKVYTIATAETETDALRKAQYYSALYQQKGLYHVIRKPSHIVTYAPA
jgi:hypothetical protein